MGSHNRKIMIEVYDNGGETFDRYTVIIDGNVYGMSHNPLSPQGFNQYRGKLSELPMARGNGDRITIESAPDDVQRAIGRRVEGGALTLTLNVVTCGMCGGPFGHKLGVETLTCPYCGYWDDVSSFPDMWSEGTDSLITIRK